MYPPYLISVFGDVESSTDYFLCFLHYREANRLILLFFFPFSVGFTTKGLAGVCVWDGLGCPFVLLVLLV